VRGTRVLVGALVVFALLVPIGGLGFAQQDPEILPVDQVKPGMRGIGKTVIQGTKIETFDVEILGVLRGGPPIPVRHLVMFRATGPVIERSGGTAAGMSGSPIYINGRLLGALSAGWTFAGPDSNLALATPIEDMLKVLEGGPSTTQLPRVWIAEQPIRVGDRTIQTVVLAGNDQEAERWNAAGLPGTIAMAPAAVPLLVTGMSDRAFSILRDVLKTYNVAAVQSRGGIGKFPEPPLEPGSAMGTHIMRGDIGLGAIGTVTWRKGNKILAFGHPFFNLGDVDFTLTPAYIFTVVRSIEHPFKEGIVGSVIGRISQDRAAAIAGEIGRFPRMFNVRVKVTNRETGKVVTMSSMVARRRDLATVLAPFVYVSALDRSMDAIGEGTAQVKMTLLSKGFPRPIVRENLFYNSRDIGLASAIELPEAMRFLFNNEFVSTDPIEISIEASVERTRRTAAIVSAEVERREVPRGGNVRVRVHVRPWRQAEQISKVIEIPIPQNFPTGPAVLLVRSAGIQPREEFPLEVRFTQLLLKEPEPIPAKNLEEAIDYFENFGRNTDLLLTVLPFGFPQLGSLDVNFLNFDVQSLKLVQTDWVIQGSFEVPLIIR